ncbi:MAG: hypothetical protein LBS68_02460 [Puniceicoccales bacterium]|jgi:hypothetical protein|nr:hypothetical protein [Puniceicoccales bacterium]
MSKTIAEYAVSPIADAYETLKEEFQKAKEFREEKLPEESLGHDDTKPSGMAYLVFAGTVVTLLAPLKIIGCLVFLLLNYAYSPVTITLTCLLLLLQKIGWVEKFGNPDDLSTAGKCIFWVAFWPLAISIRIENHTAESTACFDNLHFLQVILANSLFIKPPEDE